MQNFDEQAEKYLSRVEKQKEIEGKAVDSFTRGDMETCFVAGAQSMEELQVGCEGTFGQAIGSLKHGFLVRRKGWNGKGMFLFMRPFDTLKDEFIVDTVKAHPNAEGERFFTQYICMKAADGSIVNGWNATQVDMLSEDWVLVAPYE